MTDANWMGVAVVLMLIACLVSSVGFYRAGYAKGYLASHEIVLEMNKNFWSVLAIAKRYEKELERLEKDD